MDAGFWRDGARGVFGRGDVGTIIRDMRERLPSSLAKSLTAAVAVLLLPLCLAPHARAQERRTDAVEGPAVVEGSLAELRTRQRILLVITRSLVLDTRNPGDSLVRQAYRADPQFQRRHGFAFNNIAGRLNRYMRKYGGMSAARGLGDAEYLLVFNLLEYRRSLGRAYPYGELYVVLNQPRGSTNPPRLLWKASKVLWAEDAAKEFIDELKVVRGQK